MSAQILAFPGACFRCGEPGHIAADCDELRPATSKAEHENRIAVYVRRWETRQWTFQQKRNAISTENEMWYGDKCTPRLRSTK